MWYSPIELVYANAAMHRQWVAQVIAVVGRQWSRVLGRDRTPVGMPHGIRWAATPK